jgi:hypothetical protein
MQSIRPRFAREVKDTVQFEWTGALVELSPDLTVEFAELESGDSPSFDLSAV